MDYIISEWNENDFDAMIELGALMHLEGSYNDVPYSKEKCKVYANTLIQTNNGKAWKVVYNGEIIGMYGVIMTDYFFCHERIAHDWIMYVKPEYRKKFPMVIFRLIKRAEKWAKEKGATTFYPMISFKTNMDKTKKLFEYLKYEQIGYIFKKIL
jgi:GNAT superfamily N-acetyltransferase